MSVDAAHEHGMLALIDDAKRASALAEVREGRMYDLGHVLDENVPVFPGRYFKQTLVTTAHHANPAGGVGENQFQKTLGINDYYWGADDSELPLGHIQMLGKSDKHILRAGAPWFAPRLALDYMAKHAIDFWLTTEDLPHPSNRVTVDRAGRIHVAKTYHNLEPHKRLLGKLKSLMGPLGCHESAIPSWSILDQRIPLAGNAHQSGTVRFGTDPATSALDINCRAHDVDNLYVVDTSFFPSSAAVNPALTAMANALRVGEHLLERLGVEAAAAVLPEDNAKPVEVLS